MPTLLIWRGHKFRFYASDMPEPPHVHIVKDGKSAKVWLRSLEIEYLQGYNEREMRELIAVIAENREAWIGAWNDFFGL
jgi:Domain of unknown function (DUF4160)